MKTFTYIIIILILLACNLGILGLKSYDKEDTIIKWVMTGLVLFFIGQAIRTIVLINL